MGDFVITEKELQELEFAGWCLVTNKVRSRPLPEELKKERGRVLIPLLNQCKIEELNNKKRCDAGVDNISAFQLRARQAAFERCAIWIEESLRSV